MRPDGINIYTAYQDNHVVSRLYIKNVTETNRYGCKAYNRPVGGINIVKQDVQITMMCSSGRLTYIIQLLSWLWVLINNY